MFLVDYHTHSIFSPDSDVAVEELVKSAVKKGVKELALTDHVDLNYPPVEYYVGNGIDYPNYCLEINRLRQIYKGKLNIVLGTEVGLQGRFKNEIEAWLCGKQFDFIIGSTHIVDFKDLYNGTFFIGKTSREAITEYFADVLNSIKLFDFFHVYGHLDFIVRYGDCGGKLEYNEYREVIDEILMLLIKKGKGIEINSSGLRYGLGAPHPRLEIVKRYRELGGEIITVGSDAHRTDDVAADISIVCEMIKAAGFKAITTFRAGKPSFVDIG